ncbi:MAG: hypothetical protein ACXW34_06435, partial [Nitrospira sp.]
VVPNPRPYPQTLAVAVPFDRGALMASSHRVAKTSWGLVAGSGVVAGFERASAEFAGARGPGLEGVQAELAHHRIDTSDRLFWLFSYEDAGGNGPILYRDLGDGPSVIGWGWVLLSGQGGEGPSSDVREVLREGELRLQWDLDRGADLDTRLEALRRAFAWFRTSWEWLGGDMELGIHELGHYYSVDRVGVLEAEDGRRG